MKITKSNLYLACFLFVDILFVFFTQSKSKRCSLRQLLIQTDNSFHEIPPISFIYMCYYLYFKSILFKTEIGQNLPQDLTIYCCYQF